MSTQPPDPEIEKLLAELHSSEAFRRKSAAEKIAEQKLNNDQIISALMTIAGADENKYVRQAAEGALVALGIWPSPPPPPPHRPARAAPSPTRQFWAGFFLWLLINVPIMVLAGFSNLGIYNGPTPGLLALLINFLPLILNVAIIAWLAFTPRRYTAFGALTAFGLVLVVAVLTGPLTIAFCFSLPIVHG